MSASPVEATDYGFYFNVDTTVTVNASDVYDDEDKASGVSEIFYELVPLEGQSIKGSGKGDEIKFTVKADFKGQIYAYAVDHVNNQGDQKHPESVIVESASLHEKTSSINI